MKWFVGSLLVLSMVFQAVNWQQSIAQTAIPECPCTPTLSTSLSYFGGMECAHGEEHNAECRDLITFLEQYPAAGTFSKPSMCQELNGGQTVTVTDPVTGQSGTFACYCYECGQPDENGVVGKCEGVRVFLEATCGLLDAGAQGYCDYHFSNFVACPSIDFGTVQNFGGVPCDYSSGFQSKDKCIGGKVNFACVQPYGPTQCSVDYTQGVPEEMRNIKICGQLVID